MNVVSEEVVEETWQEISKYNPEQMNEVVLSVCDDQPNLMAFLYQLTEEGIDYKVQELTIYLFVNVYLMFQRSCEDVIEVVDVGKILSYYEKNEKLINSLDGVHEKFYERIAKVQCEVQPYVMKYLLEALLEPAGEDSVNFSEGNTGFMFMLLKTSIDLLSDSVSEFSPG